MKIACGTIAPLATPVTQARRDPFPTRSDILRLVASLYTGRVSPYDVVRMLRRDGHPTAPPEKRSTPYGQILKSLPVLTADPGRLQWIAPDLDLL